MNNLKLSVIIPCYNVEKYIEKCIYSVLDNGLDPIDFEIIVVDDESPDNSIIIAQKIADKNQNVKIISQKNKGLGGARNTGILNAIGDYVLFLDSDDWYLPNMLSPILLVAYEQQLDVLEFGAHGVGVQGEIIYSKSVTSNNKVLSGIEYYHQYRYMDSSCNKLYRKKFLIENNLFFEEHLYIEDYEFNTRVLYFAKRVMASDLVVAQFLQSANSITRNVDMKKKIKMQEDIVIVIKKVNSFYLLQKREEDLLISNYFRQHLGYLTATLFYQLLKNKSSFADVFLLRSRMKAENIFFIDYPIFDKKKEMFRKFILKNFIFMRLAVYLFKLI